MADAEPARMPRLCLIADGFAAGRQGMPADAVQSRVSELVAAGVRWVWLRDHRADADTFDRAARRLGERLRDLGPALVLSVGTHAATAAALGAHLHVGRRGDGIAAAHARGLAFGVSAHTAAEIQAAEMQGAAYATLSPLFTTATHPGAPPLGLDALARAAAGSRVPVVALGGLTPERARQARERGAWGAAVLSDLLLSPRRVWRLDRYAEALGSL